MDIMRKGRVIPAFFAAIAAVAVCLFASGCLSTGPSEATKAQWKPKFVGTWDLQEAKGDSSYSAEDLQLVREMGYDFYLELKEDGTAALVIDDDKTSGTWEVKSENVATFSAEGDTMEMKLADGKLTAEEGNKSLTFVKSNTNKGSSTTGTTTPAAGNANGSSTSRSGSENSTTKVDLTPVTIADDEVCKIVVTSKGEDFTGDPGYSLTITNKSDKSIFVTDATDSFSVNGKMATAYLNVSIKGGMYADSFMYFTRDELGGGLDSLTAVEGEIEVYSDGDFEELGHYPFRM